MQLSHFTIFAALSASAWGQIFSPASPVTGRPWSGEETISHMQTLADGTHIASPPDVTRFWRDSEGRTRTERVITPVFPGSARDRQFTSTEITDPVAGYRYTFSTGESVVRRTPLRPAVSPARPPVPPQNLPAQVRPAGRIRTTGQVPSPSKPQPDTKQESLGSDNIEGVVATGMRITTVYPIGSMGNDRPITVTRETWTSTDLGRPVLIKVTNPLNGDQTTRLTGILQSEPDPSLFQPPAGSEIKDQ